MPTFSYRALSAAGELKSGAISAPDAAEVALRLEYLGLIPIETTPVAAQTPRAASAGTSFFSRPRPEDLTLFTGDLALLLKTGARIDEALALLAADAESGRMRPVVAAVSAAILAGESFGDAIARHTKVFPALYVALVRVGESSGALAAVLETLAAERQRAEAMRRRVVDALRYPAFLLLAAFGVLTFFLMYVLPQFAGAFRDFQAKLDPTLIAFLAISDFLNAHAPELVAGGACLIAALWLASRRPALRSASFRVVSRAPLARPAMQAYRASLFCRNLGVLLSSGVILSSSLRILVDIMAGWGDEAEWLAVMDKVRHGGKLSEALKTTGALPAMAVRTLRLGEETGQLPGLAARVAEFYETRLQRSLDSWVGIAGPAAIVFISLVIGGLIVSVMTALLSVNQVVS